MGKDKTGKSVANGDPSSSSERALRGEGATARAGEIVLSVPFPGHEGATPSHPRQPVLSLDGERRRRLMALYAGLKGAGATVRKTRGCQTIDMPICEPGQALLWLLDHVEFEERQEGGT